MDELDVYLADVADAIREKEGSSEPIKAGEFSNRIRNLSSGGSGGPGVVDGVLTISKEVFVPEVPAKEGVMINSIENIEGPPGYTNYGFELNEETGYYESNNKSKGNTYSLCKVTFTVPYTMNVIWDVISNGESNYDFGIFSKIGKTLDFSASEDTDTSIVYQSYKGKASAEVVQLTYENVEAGEYFITVKYKKDSSGDNGYDSLQFKLNDEVKGVEYEPSYTYESKNEIIVDDNNNLTIEGKNILKEGDVKISIIPLKGTLENPVILNTLNAGLYTLEGYYKFSEAMTNTFQVKDARGYLDRCSPLYFSLAIYGDTKYFYFKDTAIFIDKDGGTPKTYQINNISQPYGPNPTMYEFVSSRVNSYVLMTISTVVAITQYGLSTVCYPYQRYELDEDAIRNYTALSVGNTKEYTPTQPYHPSTKKFVEDTVEISKAKVLVDDIANVNHSHANKLLATNDYNDNNIYFVKKIGEDISYEPIEFNVFYPSITIDENILNEDWSKYMRDSEIKMQFQAYTTYNIIVDFNIFVDSNGTIQYIKFTRSNTAYYAYKDGVWNFNEVDTNAFGLTEEGTVRFYYILAVSYESEFKTKLLNYLNKKTVTDKVKVMKIPLLEVEE